MTKMLQVVSTTALLVLLLAMDVVYAGYGLVTPAGRPQRPKPANQKSSRVTEIFGWNFLDFAFPNARAREQAIRSGTFVSDAALPIGVEAAGDRVFLTMPRWKNGVAATLASVPFPSQSSSPLLSPYPNWSWNRQGNCDGITSVFRVHADECGRLWVLDTGVVNAFVKAQQICTPQVVVFDLKNDKMLYRYRFPQEVLKEETLLVTLVVELLGEKCGNPTDAILYVADVTEFALIVVNLARGTAERVPDKTMYPSPEAGTFTIAGQSFELMDGVLGLALSPRGGERTLFYNAMSSYQQHWVSTQLLRNVSVANASPRSFMTAKEVRKSQAAGCDMDENGVMFFGLISNNEIGCWDSKKQYTLQNIGSLKKDDLALQFVSTVKIDPQQRLWAVSCRFQSFFLGTLDLNEVNYRIFSAASTLEAVRGTVCEPSGGGSLAPASFMERPGSSPLIFRP